MLLSFLHSTTGLVHLVAAVIALATGAAVLLLPKATVTHRRVGYVYTAAMVGVLLTSFSIYHLYGSFGIFHWLAVVSTVTLIGGMVPIVWRKPAGRYIEIHFAFMYWSVVGLYAAFFAETAVRLPDTVIAAGVPNHYFYTAAGIGTGVVMLIANIAWFRMKPRWAAQFRGQGARARVEGGGLNGAGPR